MRTRDGFTLIELLIALLLFGILGTAIYQLLVSNQRLYREQAERVAVNQTVRAASTILPGEIRELNANDPAGSDIIAMSANQLTYKAMRNLYVLCQAPLLGTLQLVLDGRRTFGLRPLDASLDSLLVFAEGDSTTRADDQWLHGNVTFTATGTACPGGQPSLTVTVGGLTAVQLNLVQKGAPVRTFEVVRMQLYQSGSEYWLGGQRYQKSGGWGQMYEVAGPLTQTGLALTYLDSLGNATGVPTNVARVAITVTGTSDAPVRGAYLQQDIVTSVALRNNPLY